MPSPSCRDVRRCDLARVGALAFVLAAVWLIGEAEPAEGAFRVTTLAIGVALIAATLAGSVIERTGLPRVTGYLVFGLLCGPYVANIITRPMARELTIVNGLAVTLIAFVAGLEVNLRRLAPRLRDVAAISATTIATLYAGFFVAFWFAWPWLPIAPELQGLQRAAAVAVTTTLVASFSPTVTIALVAERRAAGPLTELTLAIVILADLVLILVFTPVMQFAHQAFGAAAAGGIISTLIWEIGGSLALGGVAGALLALYLIRIGREVPLVVIAFCAAVAGAAAVLHVEALISALAAGMVVDNLAPSVGDRLKEAVERGALPVLVIFFAAAGASLQLDALSVVGWVALAVAGVRLALIRFGVELGRRTAALADPQSGLVWMGLVSQAGVTLGLAIIVAREQPGWGAAVQTLVLALIALHQLAGPVLFKAALDRAGESGRANAPPHLPA